MIIPFGRSCGNVVRNLCPSRCLISLFVLKQHSLKLFVAFNRNINSHEFISRQASKSIETKLRQQTLQLELKVVVAEKGTLLIAYMALIAFSLFIQFIPY